MTKGRKEIMFGGEEQTHVLIGRALPDRKDWREEDSIGSRVPAGSRAGPSPTRARGLPRAAMVDGL